MSRFLFLFFFLVFNLLGVQGMDKLRISNKNLFNGPVVKTQDDLKAYTGLNSVERIVGDWRKKAYVVNYEQLAVNYGDNVDFQLRQKQIILCPQTADFLYKKYIPVPHYIKGSRPELEKIIKRITGKRKTTKAKVLSIMRFCRDLKKKDTIKPGKGFNFGGSEELLIAKGEDLCETLGRLFVALCEVANIPARIIMHDIGGHITAEAYIDGKWGYLDPRYGVYFLKRNKQLASLWELMHNPALLSAC